VQEIAMRVASLLPLAALVTATACSTPAPVGPSVMVLPGRNASFDRFAADDTDCRSWADRQVGIAPRTAAQESVAEGAVVGTAIGAAAGAAIGAASGQPATGAAVGAGSGLLAGSLYGGSQAGWSGADVQHRYDGAYMQCMYGHGHQIPVPPGAQPDSYSSASRAYDYDHGGGNVPPPPRRGSPPPPPPNVR
jgi:hypothetical protein